MLGSPDATAITKTGRSSSVGVSAVWHLPSTMEMRSALEEDNEFLQAGGVFPADLIETWIDYKRTNEVDPIRLRPHPHEFEMYYDI